MLRLSSSSEIKRQKEACDIVREIHDVLRKDPLVGSSLLQLNAKAESILLKRDALASFKGKGFPASICTSVNSAVIHGIPTEYILQDGDILSIDVGAYKNGFHGDAARTLICGSVSPQVKSLVLVTEQSYFEDIKYFQEGGRIGDISSAIQTYVESHGFSIVIEYCGHGVGRNIHQEPEVPNYGIAGTGKRLKRGMVLAIEPMVNMGSREIMKIDDGWTIVTKDNSLSAHYENTAALTGNGVEVLTL